MCGICRNILTRPYRYDFPFIRADVDLTRHSSVECRHVFCAVCLISWWQASNGTSCPTCRGVSTQVPARAHTHETLIEMVLANAGERVDPGPFDPRVFEEFLRNRRLERMGGGGFLFTRHDQWNGHPSGTIDLTGDDDFLTD